MQDIFDQMQQLDLALLNNNLSFFKLYVQFQFGPIYMQQEQHDQSQNTNGELSLTEAY